MKTTLKLTSMALATAGVLATGMASAQVQAQGQVGGGAAATGFPQAGATAGDSDHDMMVGRLAVGYLGRRGMLIGRGDPQGAPGPAVDSVDAPIVGIRFWATEMVGIDAGIGFFANFGDTTVESGSTTVTVDDAGDTVFMLHGGVPLALANTDHFSFQIVPELNFGIAQQTIQPPPGAAGGPPTLPEVTNTGFHFDVGARAGAEIHFGFMGIPQLSLQGSIGLLINMDSTTQTYAAVPNVSQEIKISRSATAIGTTVYDNPWNIFTSNVAALYYF